MTGGSTLVSAMELAGSLGDPALRILDCRFTLADPPAGEAGWRDGHIPGALYAHLDRDLSGPRAPNAGRHPWPQAEAFAAWLGRVGVTPATRVVAYDAGDGAYAARLWWLLRSFGHARVAVLDGGLAAWASAGLPLEAAVPDVEPAPPYPGRFATERLLDPAAVAARVAAGDLLVDVRGAERFRGEVEPIDRVAGHVPGARNRPYALNLRDGRFKPAAELATEFDALLDGRAPTASIAMCGSGVTACHHLLAMAHAGRDGAALFTGSWSGWIEDPARPIATGDA